MHGETFRGVRWHRQNRLWHEANKRKDPRFSAACKVGWSRILKRPDTRYGDGRQLALARRDLGGPRLCYFVAYIKRGGFLHVISIRYATDDEASAYFSRYP
jgi:uncharacterized DUF497 family protein